MGVQAADLVGEEVVDVRGFDLRRQAQLIGSWQTGYLRTQLAALFEHPPPAISNFGTILEPKSLSHSTMSSIPNVRWRFTWANWNRI
ncbi:unnamed protein product [Linum trigynum]|uniref:Uncharacterized protein n=1 Tax=Linum trigynum TaxID=586398 RepID=A0AAV2GMJ0_9ROSI